MRLASGVVWADRIGMAALAIVTGFSILLLVAPSLIVLAVSIEPRGYISFPPSGFSLRWYEAVFANRQLTDSVLVSLRVAFSVMLVCLALGVPAAFASVRGAFAGKGALNAFLLSPQMMPGMVIGIASLFFGAYFAFRASDAMLILSLSVFCLPFVIRIAMARLAGLDPRLDEASANLGAGKLETFARVTVPQLAPALLAAGAFTFIEAFDNVTVALFTSDVRARPLPVELYYLVQFDSSPVIAAISSLEIGLSFLAMLLIARTVGLDRLGR
ncbi:ABC transporter permease [Alsobacter metallidurans]|uniref:ABC transporter permease n=1 Tax=Alsobacter metallidurans TaxID=340221 RepID=A0A917I6F7_9HYPH|nr:ABC transporter permease [Alsobacter metallidurans]GGH17866.1 ABC transporter permease [Alsobacter metallidurans]